MATERLDIIVKITNASKAGSRGVKKELKGVSVAAGLASKSVKALGASLLGLTAVFAAGRGFTNAIRTFSEFDDAMRQAGAVTQATAQEMEDLTEIAKEMGKTTRFTANQAAEGLKFLGLAGFEATEAVEALPHVLQLAAAGSLDLGQAADITTNIMAGFGLEVKELTRVNDALVKTFTSSNNNLIEIGEAFKLVGPIAKGVGANFEDLLAAIGKLGDAGLKASIGGTSLRGALAALFNPTPREIKLMEALGDRIGEAGLQVKNARGDFIGFAEITKQLEQASITGAEALELFGLRAGPGMAALVNQGSEALFKLRQDIKDSEGIAKEIAEKMEAGIGGAIRRLNAATESLKITLIDAFGGEVIAGIENTTKGINDLSKSIEANRETLKFWSNKGVGYLNFLGGVAKKITKEFIAIGAAIRFVGSVLSKASFTATVENSLEATKELKDEFNEILFLLGKDRPEIEVEIVFDEKQAFENLEELKFKIENSQFGSKINIPINVFDVASAETLLKAGLIKLSAQLDTEAVRIKQKYDEGLIDVTQYFKERESIIRQQLAKELQLLNEKLLDEADANKAALLEAAIFAKNQQLAKELIVLEQAKNKELDKLEKKRTDETKKQLKIREDAAKKSAQADKLINDLKIRNSIITSNELQDVFKNEQIRLQKRQAEDLVRFQETKANEIKAQEFANQQKLEKDKLYENQKRRLKEDTDNKFNESEKILSDVRTRNALSASARIQDIQNNELILLDKKHQEELIKFKKFTDDKVKIKELEAEQDIEREKKTTEQKKELRDQQLTNLQTVFGGVSQISQDLFELSGRQSKDLFQLSKAAAIATATVNIALGITKALAIGGPFGIATGALVAAAGAIQIAKISAQQFAEGGVIQGHSPHPKADNIPINATAGEGVLNVAAMKTFGSAPLHLMNKQAPTDQIIAAFANKNSRTNFNIPKVSKGLNFAEGGIVPQNTQQIIPQQKQTGINIVNIVDPTQISEYLNSSEGKNSVLNVISSKAKQVKRLLA